MSAQGSRTVLMLQGPPTPFWRELGAAFEVAGHKVLKINFCLADWVFWFRRGAVNYKGRASDWSEFLEQFLDQHDVTDILYYADQLPYHACVAEIARKRGVAAYAVEFGYLRPDWLTLERDGMGAFSHFPNDPGKIRKVAEGLPKPDLKVRYTHTFPVEAFCEVSFNLLDVFLPFFFPRYRSDKFYHPLVDYFSWLARLIRLGELKRHSRRVCDRAFNEEWDYFLVAMQLQSDYQIRTHSHYKHLRQMLKEVIRSFAEHAPKDVRLIIKLHPLDNGYENWRRRAAHRARRLKVRDRVYIIDDGPLRPLVNSSSGVVVVNSTTGVTALRARRPVKVLGEAIYDAPGLTHQGDLDSFWREPEPVDAALADAFLRAITATIQVRGSFYNRKGRAAACREIVERVARGEVNHLGAYEETPPRVARLRERQRLAGLTPEEPDEIAAVDPPDRDAADRDAADRDAADRDAVDRVAPEPTRS